MPDLIKTSQGFQEQATFSGYWPLQGSRNHTRPEETRLSKVACFSLLHESDTKITDDMRSLPKKVSAQADVQFADAIARLLAVVPKVGDTVPLGAVRNSRVAVKQKWAVGGR